MTGEWPFRPLNGVITCPTLRPDGSLFTAPGYDAATALYLSGTLTLPPLPAQPTRDDASVALAFLNEVLAEFPHFGGRIAMP
jgi:putative DNA primase/helicase